MIGVKHQADIEDVGIMLRRLLSSEHVEKVCGNIQRTRWRYRIESAANAIRGSNYSWKLRGQPDGCLDACLSRYVPRVRIVKLERRDRGPQNIDRIGFTGKLLHQSNEFSRYLIRSP